MDEVEYDTPPTPTGNLTPWPQIGQPYMVYRTDSVTRTVDKNRHLILTVRDGQTVVRRLMVVELERLQGFPDDWTRFGAEGEQGAEQRISQMGNAVAVPVVEWIINRLVSYTEPCP